MLARIKRNDTVMVLSGKDKGKQGVVLDVVPDASKLTVRGVAMQTKHAKARKSGEVSSIKKSEGMIAASKVMLVCRSCKKPTRIQIKRSKDSVVRMCKRCDATLDNA